MHSELTRFVDSREIPLVCMGWGSMKATKDRKDMTVKAVQALRLSGYSGVIIGGWAGLCLEDLVDHPHEMEFATKNVFFTPEADLRYLFRRCAVIVHEGNSLVTNEAMHSGTPSIITPIFYDQFYNAQVLEACRVGVHLGRFCEVQSDKLAEAIVSCHTDWLIRGRAQKLREALWSRSSSGTHSAAKLLYEFNHSVERGMYWYRMNAYFKEKDTLLHFLYHA